MNHEKIIRSIYPNLELRYGTILRNTRAGQTLYRIYQAKNIKEDGYWTELGVGNTEKWAWYMAYKNMQKECLKKLSS
jgi:hypothetical protein